MGKQRKKTEDSKQEKKSHDGFNMWQTLEAKPHNHRLDNTGEANIAAIIKIWNGDETIDLKREGYVHSWMGTH